MIGGGSKTLKTTLAEDLAVSLASGTPFLGHFAVPNPVNVGFISAESGMFTLQRNANAIAEARGLNLGDLPIFWGEKLPQICRATHLAALEAAIVAHRLQVMMVDPTYLMVLAGDTQGRSSAHVTDMGSILIGLTEIVQRTGCCILLIHHHRKHKDDPFAPPELSDLTGAGYAEWARQWLLIGRREHYEHGTGIHRLWLNVGGSAGHSSLWTVDVNEGVIDDHLQGRCWEVMVQAAVEARHEAKAAKEAEKKLAEQSRVIENASRILKHLERFPEGTTVKAIREGCNLNPTAATKALDQLRESEEIEDCTVTKSNNQTYPGVRKTTPLEHRN